MLAFLGPTLTPSASRAAVTFQEVATSKGLVFTSGHAQAAFPQIAIFPVAEQHQRTTGTGAAVGDYDGDGDLDVYLLGHLNEPNRLFRNDLDQGPAGFTDVTPPVLADLGLSRVAHFADLDGDGDPDLVLLNDHDDQPAPVSEAKLFRNDGGNTWTDVTLGSGFEPVGFLRHGATIADYDGDGRLDIYVTNWGGTLGGGPAPLPGSNRLYRNIGALRFEDVTDSVGLGSVALNSCTPVFADFDDDGDPDLYVALDWFANRFFRNDGGTFVEIGAAIGADHVGNDMGLAVGDADGDGDLDVYSTNITDPLDAFSLPNQGNVFLENQLAQTGSLSFVDRAAALGVEDTGWGWGTQFADLENDGDLDLLAVSGFEEVVQGELPDSLPMSETPNVVFESDGAGGYTRLVSSGFELTDDARGLVSFDYDRDGDLDVLVTNHAEPVRLFENQSTGQGSWLTVRLSPDPLAIGATVHATVGAVSRRRDVLAGQSYLVGTPSEVHFGLGAAAQVDQLRVVWADGSETVLADVAVDQVIDVVNPNPFIDTDYDGLADDNELLVGTDPQDPDSDDDGLFDAFEVGDVADPTDTDDDGTIDALDPDDDGDGVPTSAEDYDGDGNPANDDADGDGIPDYREVDADDDGTSDDVDNCPVAANPTQSDVNGDGIGDACQPDDADGDGWPNDVDNCPVVANPPQDDTDEDGIGDACTDTRSVARQWNEELLSAIRRDLARPTVHARNLFHVSAAMWDAWAAYDPDAQQVLHVEKTTDADVEAARARALSFAAYGILKSRFAGSPGAAFSLLSFDARMDQLGYDRTFTATAGGVDPPAELGNRIAASVLAFGLTDGSNEQNGYANQYYQPVNPALIMLLSGNPDILDRNRWQPLALDYFVDQSGNPIAGGFPPFLSPEWGQVTPFSLAPQDATVHPRDGFDYWVYHDPGPPFLLGTASAEDYLDGFEMVALWSSHLDPADGVVWDISPASMGNSPLPEPEDWRTYYDFENGGDWGTGYATNPVTGLPYTPQPVARGDYARILAEFWADGPDSETPPGHWFTIANYVADNLAVKQLGGTGPAMSDLEWYVKFYLTLGGTMHDVAVAVWGMKGWYDYVRPVSALRAMAEKGQRSNSGLPAYDPEGLELRPGFIELVTPASSAPGERHEHLAAHVDEVAIKAWRGPDFITDPETDVAGVGWILAKEWWPYQRPSFVTPPFAGFPSGHSAYSRAAALVLHRFTGSPYFPNGLGTFEAPMNEFLVFEDGPSANVTLQFASYYDASDQTSLSRIWGGIHPPQDDIVSRHIGAQIGSDAYEYAMAVFDTAECTDGLDNDGDGLIDHPADPGCLDADSASEWPECQDGLDNDGDGFVDFDGGIARHGYPIAMPDPRCIGDPDRQREANKKFCGLGAELLALMPLVWAVRRRRRGPNADRS
ncbi:MAG: FG-GAP-like repeat-containing protein [Myxococcota bacterium]